MTGCREGVNTIPGTFAAVAYLVNWTTGLRFSFMQPPQRFARVIVDRSADREFDYLIPANLAGRVEVGSRVRLPFRNRAALGTVVDLPEESAVPEASLRPLNAVIGDKPIISPVLIELARWMADYYCCPVETAMRSVLPQVIRDAEVGDKKQLFARLVRAADAGGTRGVDQTRPASGRGARRADGSGRAGGGGSVVQGVRRDAPDDPGAGQGGLVETRPRPSGATRTRRKRSSPTRRKR